MNNIRVFFQDDKMFYKENDIIHEVTSFTQLERLLQDTSITLDDIKPGNIYIHTTPTQHAYWNGKADVNQIPTHLTQFVNDLPPTPIATQVQDGLLSKFDKQRLDNISESGQIYVHPTGFTNKPTMQLTGNSVISRVVVNSEGHVVNVDVRQLTPVDIGLPPLDNLAVIDGDQTFDGIQTFLNSIVGNIDTASRFKTPIDIQIADQVISFDGSQNITFTTEEMGLPSFSGGSTSDYYRGDQTWQILNTTAVAEGSNLYFTNERVHNAISAENVIYVTNGVIGHTNNSTTRHVTDAQIAAWDAAAGQAITVSSPITYVSGVVGHTNSSTVRHVTDTQINSWDSKLSSISGSGVISVSGSTISHTNNSTTRHVTDAQIAAWNAGSGGGAIVVSSPITYVSGVIGHTDSTTIRHVTDTEKSTWNNKVGLTGDESVGGLKTFNDGVAAKLNTRVVTGSTTLTLSDLSKMVIVDSSTVSEVTVPSDSVAFPIGSTVGIFRKGDGEVIVLGGSGVVLRAGLGSVIANKYTSCTVVKIGSNEWAVLGNVK